MVETKDLDKPFTREDVSIEQEETAYSGFFTAKKFTLRHTLFAGGQSALITRELFCRGQSVGILLYDPQLDCVGLTRQFRIGCLDNVEGPWVWEVIAGVNDKNETPQQVAVREVAEESGIVIEERDLLPICGYYTSPGGTDEYLQLYCALTSLAEAGGVYGLDGEGEDILFKTLSYDMVISAMLNGSINNAATVIALQWLQLNKARLAEN